ncbi:hypothetical protein ACLKA7_014684 [Drosophila subpalustris]
MCGEDETLTLEQALRKALIMESKIATKTVSSTDAAEGINFMRRSKKGSTSSSQQQDSNSSKKKPCKYCGWRNHASTASESRLKKKKQQEQPQREWNVAR